MCHVRHFAGSIGAFGDCEVGSIGALSGAGYRFFGEDLVVAHGLWRRRRVERPVVA